MVRQIPPRRYADVSNRRAVNDTILASVELAQPLRYIAGREVLSSLSAVEVPPAEGPAVRTTVQVHSALVRTTRL